MLKKTSNKKRIVLLDVHAIIHRAYHALPEFTGPTGAPTGALYGLVAMLLKIITDLKPDYIAACFDLPGPTIRHEAYDGYKGTRAKTDDILIQQIKEAPKIFKAFSIPMYSREGFEADDLLGTIAKEIKNIADVIIASGDMDTLQLVDDERVRVYTLKKGINDTILYNEKAVLERFGFLPSLIPDWKGLRGDPSDNIKGVPGIGEKTATDLIKNFGSIEKIYAVLKKKNGEEIFLKKGVRARIINLLREHEENARFSKSLSTIRLDAPTAFTLPETDWSNNIDVQKMLAMCDEFGFRTLKERIRASFRDKNDLIEEDTSFMEPVDESRLREAQVMLWLISSEFTNPSLDDILAFTKQKTFSDACRELERRIREFDRVKDVYEKIERPLIPVVLKMSERGIFIDTTVLGSLSEKYHNELEEIEKNIYKLAGREFNINSPKQLGEMLFDELNIIPEKMKRTAGGQRSTRESELEKLKNTHPIISHILEYRELRKLLSTYIDNLPPMLDHNSRLHAEFLQTGTTTGRISSQNPNLQNIPHRSERGRAIRGAFIASGDFVLVSLDYSQIELRIAAILSGDEKLCEIFKKGRDVHQEVATQVFHISPNKVDSEMRRRAKIINFGILYGMGANALKAQLGSTMTEAHQYLEEYFNNFKTLSEYMESIKGYARKYGYTETLFGRRRQFPEMKSFLPYVRAQAERMAINAPIQGTSADIVKLAMVRVEEMICEKMASDDVHLLLQVHDELVYEIRENRMNDLSAKIKEIMESILTTEEARGVPIIVSMKSGKNWNNMIPL